MPVNRHHVFFEKAQYQRHRLANLVREHPVNVQPMDIYQHRELHAHTLGGLAVITNGLARETLDFLNDLPVNCDNFEQRRLPMLESELENFERLARRKSILGREATYFAGALEHQLGFLR
jgi:hypothetical protein